MNLEYEDIRTFVYDNLKGKTLETIARKKKFAIEVSDRGLIYTPSSTGKPRLHMHKFIERFINRFNETGSLASSTYTDISKNGSYLLPIIKMFLDGERIMPDMALQKPEEIRIYNMVDMGLRYSGMIRLYKKGSKSKLITKILKMLPRISKVDSKEPFEKLHYSFCR